MPGYRFICGAFKCCDNRVSIRRFPESTMAGVEPGDEDVNVQIRAVLYGTCIGDALGLLTEFMSKEEAKHHYGEIKKLSYSDKVDDGHRSRWEVGDWTDDSDQMILIMKMIIESNGKVAKEDFGHRIRKWRHQGFRELGDLGGMGIGLTTHSVLGHQFFQEDPHKASQAIWKERDCNVAPNGGVMRTSVLGCFRYKSIEEVTKNTLEICKVTHYDPRCQASCVVVTTAIALMLRKECYNAAKKKYDVNGLLKRAYDNAVETVFKDLEDKSQKKKELKQYVFEKSKQIKDLQLDEFKSIGYTYKCLGSGCWALRQKDFETAMQQLTMEGGDADTNGAVAGALLGCKLGLSALDVRRGDSGWLSGLLHKDWLDDTINKFLEVAKSCE